MRETFGENIRKLRTEKGYTLTQLGAKLGIDSGALSKIETDKKVFDNKLLPVLAEIFNLDIKKLKDEYYSEAIANVLYENHCSDSVLMLAEEKVKYKKIKNTKQANINFK